MGWFSKKKPEMVWMTLEQAQAMCTPARNCQLTGANQERFSLGEAGAGGYFEAVGSEQSHEHSAYWENGHALPTEAPDMGRVQVNTGHRGAAGNQQEYDRWHHLNADEWARVNATEYEQAKR